jgi:hypothetical protein
MRSHVLHKGCGSVGNRLLDGLVSLQGSPALHVAIRQTNTSFPKQRCYDTLLMPASGTCRNTERIHLVQRRYEFEVLLGPVLMRSGHNINGSSRTCHTCDVQGELVTGDPLFPGDSDIDQLYKVREIVGEITNQQRTLFQTHPDHKHLHLAPIHQPETIRAHFDRHMDATEIDFMEGLLNVDPKKRRSASECLQHPYLLEHEG